MFILYLVCCTACAPEAIRLRAAAAGRLWRGGRLRARSHESKGREGFRVAAGCAAAGALVLEASEGRFGTAAGAHTGSRRDGFGTAAAAGSCALKGGSARQ